jgi:O-antigen ligase
MPLRGIAFAVIYFACFIGAFFAPWIGVIGYIATYCIGPENEWWAIAFRHAGIRFSLLLAAATAVGFIFGLKKFKREALVWDPQEIWFWIFIAIMWLSHFMAPLAASKYTSIDQPAVKMLKIGFFLFMYTRLMSDEKRLNSLLWTFAVSSLVLGIQAWETPWAAFRNGRLEHMGGADFAESNFFGAFMAAMLPIIGVQIIKSKWRGKVLCVLAAAFTCNAVILCRSRGAFLGIAAGVLAAAAYTPKRYRLRIFLLLLIGLLGGIRLMDKAFIERTLTIARPLEGEQMDSSAASRPRLWKAGLQIMLNYPFGVGPGRWFNVIGDYIPEYKGKDAHSTFARAMGELGLPGVLAFLAVIYIGFKNLGNTRKITFQLPSKDAENFECIVFGTRISLIVILVSGLFITMTYTEALWLLLFLPACILKAARNKLASQASPLEQKELV